MFTEEIEKAYGRNTPVFTKEILELFSQYTRAYVFRLIRKAQQEGKLVLFSRGVYYIPETTAFGESSICSEMVAEKKYIKDGDTVYGIYSGLNLLNQFGITEQVPNTVEIVTNYETTRKRRVEIEGRNFILRESRCEITEDNYPVYTVLQLFSDIGDGEKLDDFSKKRVGDYIMDNGVTMEKIASMSDVFPSRTLKRMIRSGVLSGIIQK